MNFEDKTLGIWGFGVVGKSLYNFFKKQNVNLIIYDDRLNGQQHPADTKIPFERDLSTFLKKSDYIVPSAGVAIPPELRTEHTFIYEVDLFYALYKKPIIAVSGTIGKTTVATALTTMLTYYGYSVQLGGNIGVGLLDLVEDQAAYDYAVIELSSFQLEHIKRFVPTIAIWTNLYPNHLDRHQTMEDYFLAKYSLIQHQSAAQHALVHESVRPYLQRHPQKITYFSTTIPEPLIPLITTNKLHQEHYIILYEVARIMHLDIQRLPAVFDLCSAPDHRVQLIDTVNGVDFYDDSKSTVIEATRGALAKFLDKKIILFFGGTSKGTSREHFFIDLPPTIKHICFFGTEATMLATLCPLALSKSAHSTLEDAFTTCTDIMQSEDVVLFSPGGASFDLFQDYKERGKTFQKLVHNLRKTIKES